MSTQHGTPVGLRTTQGVAHAPDVALNTLRVQHQLSWGQHRDNEVNTTWHSGRTEDNTETTRSTQRHSSRTEDNTGRRSRPRRGAPPAQSATPAQLGTTERQQGQHKDAPVGLRTTECVTHAPDVALHPLRVQHQLSWGQQRDNKVNTRTLQ